MQDIFNVTHVLESRIYASLEAWLTIVHPWSWWGLTELQV